MDPATLALIATLGGVAMKGVSGYNAAQAGEKFQKKQLEFQRREARKAALERALTGRRTGGPAFSRYTEPPTPPNMANNAILGGLGDVFSFVGSRGLK